MLSILAQIRHFVTSLWRHQVSWANGGWWVPFANVQTMIPHQYHSSSVIRGTATAPQRRKMVSFSFNFTYLWRHSDVTDCHGPLGLGQVDLPMSKLSYHTNSILYLPSGDHPQPENCKNVLFWPNHLWRHSDVTNHGGPTKVGQTHSPMSKLWYHTNISSQQWVVWEIQPENCQNLLCFWPFFRLYDVTMTSLWRHH